MFEEDIFAGEDFSDFSEGFDPPEAERIEYGTGMDPSDYGRVHYADVMGTKGVSLISRDPVESFYEQVAGKVHSYIAEENLQKGVKDFILRIPSERVIGYNIDVLVVVSTYIVETKWKKTTDTVEEYIKSNPDINPLDFVRYYRMLS